MITKSKRALSAILAIFMIVSSITVFTVASSAVTSGDWEYSLSGGKAEIKKYSGVGGDLTIPSAIDGYPVVSIGLQAFCGCTGITSLTIPESISSIGYYAFSECTGLTSVVIPDTVSLIGYYAFSDCTGLSQVTLGNGITVISDAFAGCTGLKSIVIPDSVTRIDTRAFSGCTGLTSVTIPDSVESIGFGAFSGCTALTSVTIPDSVTTIDVSVFSGCDSLRTLYVEVSDLTEFAETSHRCYSFLPSNLNPVLVNNGVPITELVVPDNDISIEDYAFYNCAGFTKVVIPDSVTGMGERAFSGCTDLTEVSISKRVTSIGDYAFSGCSGLEAVVIPDNVTNIGECAFSGCTALKSVVIPDKVTRIGGNAFSGCTSLESAVVGNSVTSVGGYAFNNCKGLTSVIIPNSVTTIGDYAFWNCDKTKLTIWAHVGSYAEEYAKSNRIQCRDNYTDVVVTAPTCTTDGYTTYVCDVCNNTFTSDTVSALGHLYDNSCDTVCNRCGDIREITHNYVILVTEPTCTTDGYRYHVCSVCGDSYTDGAGPAKGHTPLIYVHDSETHWRKCVTCGTIIDIPSAHVFDSNTDSICDVCGYARKVRVPGDANGDGTVNLSDVTAMLKFIANWDTPINESASDVNADGKVNLSDVTLILKYLANWDVEII